MTTVRRFEHEILKVGPLPEGGNFTPEQWDALIRWQDKQAMTYFSVVHRGIKLSQWVGVLQVGSLTIEILPKAEREQAAPREQLVSKWKGILYRMLHVSRNLDLKVVENASIRFQQHTLLDLVFERFLDHAEALMAMGLIKSYRQVSANRRSVRGRLLVGKNETHNHIHRERIYTMATEYDRDNVWNRILHAATLLSAQSARPASLRARAQSLLLHLPDQDPIIEARTFDHLTYGRRTEGYRPMIRYAELLLRHTNPDLQGGDNQVFALLFDMNKLWESWVLASVRKQFGSRPDCRVTSQAVLHFWGTDSVRKVVKPDIVIRFDDGRPPMILDTKWKVLDRCEPSDDDLKQMYVYERLMGVHSSTLIYPEVHLNGLHRGPYTDPGHALQLLFLDPQEKSPDLKALFEGVHTD